MLAIRNLSIAFSRYGSGLGRTTVRPVRDVSLDIAPGEIVAVVGSSGSGKSLVAHAILGLLPANAATKGEIRYRGSRINARDIKSLRGREIALIPQSVAYLNPLCRVGRQVYRAARLSGNGCTTAACNTDAAFTRYHLTDSVKSLFPFQVSGGMARRVLTATATAGDASLLIADEPTTGLDPTVARQSLGHLRELADAGKSVMLITHDMETALGIADRVAVIYGGTTVELAPAANFGDTPDLRHPYTRALWQALPRNGFRPLPGNQPLDDEALTGCIFHARCPERRDGCDTAGQPLRAVGQSLVRCNHA
jgi:peptide/nickel transport system ATP-binding protein